MLLNFCNGIVQKQPIIPFLIKNGKFISLNCTTAPLILTFSHGSSNYLTIHPDVIKNAWGPFNKLKDYYLYVDIDINTAEISFGATHLPPKSISKLPLHAEIGQHYFEFKSRKMYEKRSGLTWKEVIRVFVGEFRKSAILKCYDIVSNFNLNTINYSGMILFDENRKPIKKENSQEFLTTESELTIENGYIGKIDQHLNLTKCLEAIPKHSCISISIDNKNYMYCKLAKNGLHCNGITQNGHASGDIVNYIKYGYLYDVLGWNFSKPSGSPLFLSENGTISETPSRYIIQQVGFIVDSNTIFVDIKNPIKTSFNNINII
jgi:hypothetical protein